MSSSVNAGGDVPLPSGSINLSKMRPYAEYAAQQKLIEDEKEKERLELFAKKARLENEARSKLKLEMLKAFNDSTEKDIMVLFTVMQNDSTRIEMGENVAIEILKEAVDAGYPIKGLFTIKRKRTNYFDNDFYAVELYYDMGSDDSYKVLGKRLATVTDGQVIVDSK